MTIDYAKARETMVEQQVRPWDVFPLSPNVISNSGTWPNLCTRRSA